MRRIVSRPELSRLPSLPLPVYVRSAGYNEAPPGWAECEDFRAKPFVQVFWCIQGIGEFRIGENRMPLHADEAIYRLPGETHLHRSADARIPWRYCWFTFEGPNARDFMLSYGYEQKPHHAGPCPVRLFSELESLVVRRTPYAQRHALSVATEILALFGSDAGAAEHDTVRAFLDLVEKNYTDPGFTVEAAAESLAMHRATLYRIVNGELACSPKQYLQQYRLGRALSLLVESELSVKCVASACGFGKVDRFCELVAQATGETPARYRRSAAVDFR